LESVNKQPPHTECCMNEIHWVLLGLIVMVLSVAFFYYTDILPAKIESREVSIVISLGIGLLILVVDKRQDRHLNEIIEAQHKMTNEIHKMIKEEIRLIKEMQITGDKQEVATAFDSLKDIIVAHSGVS
jgi:hypothetical protein